MKNPKTQKNKSEKEHLKEKKKKNNTRKFQEISKPSAAVMPFEMNRTNI
jgi:hypothetical protein